MSEARSIWTARGALILALITASSVLNYADRQIIAVLKPMMQHDLGWTDVDYGNFTSVFQFASAVALLFAGWLVDRIGWRRANPLAVGLWSLAAMAHAFARAPLPFTLARVALGATEALGTPTAIKTIASVFPNAARSMAVGVMNAASSLGAIVTPLVIPLLALKIGWANSFLVTGGLGLIWVALWMLLRPGRATPAELAAAASAPPPPAEPVHWGEVLADRRTWAIAGAKVLSDQVWWLLLFWMPDLFHRVFGLDMDAYGAPLALTYAGSAAGSLISGLISTELLRRGAPLGVTRKGMLLVSALLVLPLWFAPAAGNYWIAAGILALTLAAHQSFSVNVFALATDISPPARIATVIAVGAFCGNLAGMVILQVAGWTLGHGYGYAPLLAWASVSYLLGAGWVQLLLPRITAAAPEPQIATA